MIGVFVLESNIVIKCLPCRRRLTRLLSHPWYLTSVDQNDIRVEAWSMITRNNLGYNVGKEFSTIYRKHLGQSKLDWKQNFLKQPNGKILKPFVANFDKFDKSDGMAFLDYSHICISHAREEVFFKSILHFSNCISACFFIIYL